MYPEQCQEIDTGFDFTVKVCVDYDSEYADPRQWDNLGIMYCWHPDYKLGDEQFDRGDFSSLEEVHDYLVNEENALLVLPLSVYEHSGLTMFVGHEDAPFDPGGWDTTYCGFIYVNGEQLDKHGVKPGDAEEILKQEVATYASWLEGDVCYYVIEEADGNVLDSCGGFIGYENAKEEALQSARDCQLAVEQRLHVEISLDDLATILRYGKFLGKDFEGKEVQLHLT